VVIEFILNHVDEIFNNGTPGTLENNGNDSSGICPTRLYSFFGPGQVRVGLVLALTLCVCVCVLLLCVTVCRSCLYL
jgi:hypothetical protein